MHRPPTDRSEPAAFALAGARVFDGERMLDAHAVVVRGPLVEAVLPLADAPADLVRRDVAGLLAPGFIDVQVNGGGGVLFNQRSTVDGIAAIARAHRQFGTTGLLPTFISDGPEQTAQAVIAVGEAIVAGVPGILGIHLEGPFLNPARAGVHDRRCIRPMGEADVALLTSPGSGVRLVTLAPEMVPPAMIARLAAAGVIVSAGHTEATPLAIAAARSAGLTGFTHLYNTMPPLTARAPGPIGAALAEPDLWAGLIADLRHVSVTALRVAIAARGWQRTFLATDAMPTVGSNIAGFTLHGRPVARADGQLTTDDGTLAGSDLDMASAVRNLVGAVGIPLPAALHMASRAPAEFLRLGDRCGRIAPGYRASMVLLDDDLRVTATWIDGA